MDLNRNQFLFLGVILLLVGLQVRCVNSYVLNPEATRFLAERTGQTAPAATTSFFTMASATPAAPRKILQPPEWLGWCLISVGAVLTLHSLAMKRPA